MDPRVEALDAAALVACLQEHSHDPGVQAQCCLTLCESGQLLSADSALAFLPAIVAALRAHPGHAGLQTYGCAVLWHICTGRGEDELASAGDADGVRALVDAMRAFPALAGLQFSCCGALYALSRSAGLRQTAVAAGAVHAMVAALHAHVLYEAGVVLMCDALSRIAVKHPLAMEQAGAAGGVTAVVAAMCAHPASAVVQASCCSALGSLAYDADNQKAAIRAGAIEAILQAMRAHSADAKVQNYGCRALGNIAESHTDAISARSSSLLLDALKAVVAALNAHIADACMQGQVGTALWHLLVTDALRIEAGKIGAVTATVAALRAHPADAAVQQTGCDTMSALCLNNSANAVQACGAGALQAIVAGMRAHPAGVNVQMAGCNALNRIMDAHPRIQAAAGAAGAVEAVAAAMLMPSAGTDLKRLSCEAMLTLTAGHGGNAARACAAGVMDAWASIMGTSCAHETMGGVSLYDWGVGTLDALVEGNEDAALRAIHAGVLDIMAREGTQRCDPSAIAPHARLLSLLQAAAARHDAAVCTHDGCKRCAAARDCGRVCALAGCGARKRADGSRKKLLRCGACGVAAYCGPAHQREHWARHKDACAALGAARVEEEGEQQSDE
jgi:hypothetical protein